MVLFIATVPATYQYMGIYNTSPGPTRASYAHAFLNLGNLLKFGLYMSTWWKREVGSKNGRPTVEQLLGRLVLLRISIVFH